MKSTRSSSSFQGTGSGGVELSLTGLPAPVSRRPSSASPAKHMARSISVTADGKPKRNAPTGRGTGKALRLLCCGTEFSHVGERNWLAKEEGGARGRGFGACLRSRLLPPWQDDQPRAFPGPAGSRGVEPPVGMRRKEATVLLAANFTANNRSNKGAMGNCVTTMVHNNYSTAEKGPAPKSSNQAPSSLNNVVKPTSNEDGESSSFSFVKSQKNFSSNNIMTRNNNSSLPRRKEVTEEEMQRALSHFSAVGSGRCGALSNIFDPPLWKERQQQMEEGNILDLRERKDKERQKIREEKARLARRAAIQVGPGQGCRGLAEVSLLASSCEAAREPLLCTSRDVSSRETGGEDLETVVTAVSRAQSKVTLNELLDTLRLLEEEPELLPPPKLFKKDRYAWIDGEPSSNSLTADNLEKFGKLNHSPGVPEDGALLSEAKLQSIISFLDEMEKSEQERPRSAEELAHLEQASAVATEVTSSIMRLKLEVEEKKRAISLLQTALAQQRELTVRHVNQTEKELGHQLRLQREQYEAAIQRHLAFIDQLIDDKKVLSEKCEAVVAELKQVDQKYGKKITQMQEQHELEIKKLKELMSATEKIRREKWIDEKTKKIKEITVKGLEPEIQKLIAKHRQDIKKLKMLHEAELLQSDERAAQRYGRQAEELRGLLEREKEEQSQRERERARQRYVWFSPHLWALDCRSWVRAVQSPRRGGAGGCSQPAWGEQLLSYLSPGRSEGAEGPAGDREAGLGGELREEGGNDEGCPPEVPPSGSGRVGSNICHLCPQEAWLLTRERELREEARKERDKEIELVIQRLEADMSLAKEECERAAENRIKRIRDKYEVELQELERSERKLQERCNELKGRLAELEGESIRLQGLLKHKEQEVEEIQKVKDQLAQERSSLAEVIRQEFADRLVGTEEENKRLKAEMAEMRARQRLELDRVVVKTAVVRKEESVSSLRKQYEAAVQRANRLEALLEQQRKQLLVTK
uniref:Centrosomal protein 131 n=1 Tax=Athene cunicularia TaxID=194338 RepID=A0A663M773_ATHCN